MSVFYDGESLLRLVDVETRFGLFATKEGDKLRAGVAFRPPTGPAGAADGQALSLVREQQKLLRGLSADAADPNSPVAVAE